MFFSPPMIQVENNLRKAQLLIILLCKLHTTYIFLLIIIRGTYFTIFKKILTTITKINKPLIASEHINNLDLLDVHCVKRP